MPPTPPTDTGPRTSERPSNTQDAAALMGDSSGSVLFVGGGTKQRWGGTPQTPELIVETRAMSSVLTHAPADMTAAVQAGITLSDLQRALAEHRQWLAIDPPSEAGGATIGGLLASGDSGPRRLRYGTLRDHVIGATMVLADGTVAHTGGQVIKNVAGYDLTKLMYGSLGTLALITEVVLRLHPIPDASATVTAACNAQQATDVTLQMMASPLDPAAIEWDSSPGPAALGVATVGQLKIRFDGREVAARTQADTARQLLRNAGLTSEVADSPDALWQESARRHSAVNGIACLRAGTKPSDLPTVVRTLAETADTTGCQATLFSQCGVGTHTVRLSGSPEAQSRCIATWRSTILGLDGNILVQDRPPSLDAHLDALGPPPSAVQLLRNIKDRLDPNGRCAPGRFGTWY